MYICRLISDITSVYGFSLIFQAKVSAIVIGDSRGESNWKLFWLKMGVSVPTYMSIITFFCTVGAIALAVFHIYRHLKNYTEPTYQRYIVRIIFMVPVSS